jgi:hypothetical protein
MIPFTIVLDKGYRIASDAFNAAGQFTLQPIFTQCDQHFTIVETFISCSVATNCASNEWNVRYMKISDFISKGLLSAESIVNLCDTLIAWGYQVNFMYKSVQ